MKCQRCDIGVVGKPHWQKVEGWVQKRQRGGSNHIALKEHKSVYLCEPCMHLAKAGMMDKNSGPIEGQTSLTCDCGNPGTDGVVHRSGAPCYHK
jgi:hypothetical protein